MFFGVFRHVLRKLVSARVATSDVLSLEEMLAEGCVDNKKPRRSKFEQVCTLPLYHINS